MFIVSLVSHKERSDLFWLALKALSSQLALKALSSQLALKALSSQLALKAQLTVLSSSEGSQLTVLSSSEGSQLTVLSSSEGSQLTVLSSSEGSQLTVLSSSEGSQLTVLSSSEGSQLTVLSERRLRFTHLPIPTSALDTSVDRQIAEEYSNGHHAHLNPHKDHHHPEGAEQGFTGNLELRSDEDVESDSTMSDIESEEEEEDDEFVDHAEEVMDRQKHHEDIIGGAHHIHHHHHHHYHRAAEDRGREEALAPSKSTMSMGGSLPDGEQLSPKHSALSGIVRSDTADSRREDSPDMLTHKSKHKTFTFGMPFSNPLANKENKKGKKEKKIKRATTFGSVFQREEDEEELAKMDSATQAEHESIAQIRQKLNRNLSITTEEEDKLFGNKHDLQSVRVNKIVSNATMPTVLDSVKIGNKKKLSKHDAFNGLEGDFVILGGYRGSVLRDTKTKRRVWIPIKVGFNLRKIDLTVDTSDEAEQNMEKTIYPDGMLTHIGPIDLSKRLIQKISYNPKCRIRDFGYDWRLDCGFNAHKLIEFLEKIYAENGGKKITVMAHSMGGLVTHKAMLLRPDLFKGVLYLGSPSECPAIIGPIKNGDAVLLSSKVLTAQINFLMRSSFVFLPEDKQLFVDKTTGKRIDIDFYDPEQWKKYALSPCVSEEHRIRCQQKHKLGNEMSKLKPGSAGGHHHHHGFHPGEKLHKLADIIAHPREHKEHYENMHPEAATSGADAMAVATGHSGLVTMGSSNGNNDANIPTVDYDDACRYLERTLKRTKELRASFWYDEARKDEYPPLACVVGTTVPTLKACRVDGFEGIYKGDFSDFVLGSGDGVVYSKWNMPEPFGFKVVAKVKTNRGHVGLMTDHAAVAKALLALQDAAEKREKGEQFLPDITPVHSIPVTDDDSTASTPVQSPSVSTQGSPAPGQAPFSPAGHNPGISSPLKH